MLVIGLGTCIGNRLQNLRTALAKIKKINGLKFISAAPVYVSDAMLPDNAPESWNLPFLNSAIACSTQLNPETLLAELQKIEIEMGRAPLHAHWSPRIIDIDILAWDDRVIQREHLTVPQANISERPFALWPLADLMPLWIHPQLKLSAEQLVSAWGSRYSGEAPFHTRQINQRIDTPALVGVINVTPDSFSDGGKFHDVDHALQQAEKLMASGAEILDIGAEPTSPDVKPIDAETEWQRLNPVLAAITQSKMRLLLPPLISIDTRRADVAERALAYPIDWLNDVTGFQDARMRAVARGAKTDCVVMHHVTIPPTQQSILPRDQHPADFLFNWSQQQLDSLEKDGISRERIILDPGIGFGKSAGQSLGLLQQIERFAALNTRLLVGHARKSFMASFTPHPAAERDVETMMIAALLNRPPVDYLRVHNVEYCARAFRVQALFA